MPEIAVWAPKQKKIAVKVGDQAIDMQPEEKGWWRAEVPGDGTGAVEYCFVLADTLACPDPRSGWQPEGVHGPSRLVDHSRFAWTDHGWQAPPLAAALIYELHIGTFTPQGTFAGAMEKLDYLKELGVTHVELMPVAEFPGERGWGYDGVDLFAPHHAYGSPDDLKRLVDACHARGLAVLLDVVYNHLGPDGNYLGQFGPYFTNKHHTGWGEAVNFDGPGSDEVRRFFIDNALMWLRDYHFDGLRLDAVHAILDTSAVHFLEELAGEVQALEAQLGRHLVLIAESDLNDPRIVQPPEVGGYGMDAQWSDDFHHTLHTLLTGERGGYYADFGRMEDLAQALREAFVYNGRYAEARGRRHGRPVGSLPPTRFLGYLQNHDQIGNRAQGERIGCLVAPELARIGAALVLMAPFIPMLFQGEEWNASTPFLYFTDHQNAELGKAVSEGRRKEFAAFGWDAEQVPDPQARETFERSKLNWEELRNEPHQNMLQWYRELIRLRQSHPDLAAGSWEGLKVEHGADWIVLRRGRIRVACNLGEQEQVVEAAGRVLLASGEAKAEKDGKMRIPPRSVVIVEGE